MNNKIVSVTQSGQLTVPKAFREELNIKPGSKAIVKIKDGALVVEPRLSFDQLSGSLSGDIKLNDKQLKEARKDFEKSWANGK